MSPSIRAARLAGLLASVTAVASLSRAEDIIYVPAGFPDVCAQSLTRGTSYCPEGVSREATAFCSESLPNLRRWVSQQGLAVCGDRGGGNSRGTGFDQVLLVDDRNLVSPLSNLLTPVVAAGHVAEKSGPFRDEDRVVRSVWIVGEGGGAPGSGGRPGSGTGTGGTGTGGGGSSSGGGSAGGGGPGSPSGSTGEGTTGGSETAGTGGQPPADNTGTGGGAGTEEGSAQGGTTGASSECRPGDQEFVEETRTIRVAFHKDYLQFRSRVGQGLARYMVTSRAHQFAVASNPLREFHAQLVQLGVTDGQPVDVTAQIKRRRCDRRVETVEFPVVSKVDGD